MEFWEQKRMLGNWYPFLVDKKTEEVDNDIRTECHMKDHDKIKRIHKELKEVGMTNYGLFKIPTSHLPELIGDDENIKGVVYGRLDDNFGSVMLVATNKRILFLDFKPLYRNIDEITYDVVAGIQLSAVGIFAGVVLHTRVKDYSLKFVNLKCANIFTKYLEKHLEKGSEFSESKKHAKSDTKTQNPSTKLSAVDKEKSEDMNIVLDTNTAIISTVDQNGNPHASVIHYIIDREENYFFITKINTTKAKNISKNNNVALTIHHTDSLKSLLIKGECNKVEDLETIKQVYKEIVKPRNYLEGKKLPPITKLDMSDYIVYRIKPELSDLQDYSIYNW